MTDAPETPEPVSSDAPLDPRHGVKRPRDAAPAWRTPPWSGKASPAARAQHVITLCREVGFAAAGVCDASPSRYAEELRAWLAAGRHGSMSWMLDDVASRCDPARLLPGARSVLMVASVYADRASGGMAEEAAPFGHGKVARYARGRDYHRALKQHLHRVCDRLRHEFPGAEFRSFVDTAPVPERELAARAGLGWVGKHTLLIHPRLGSGLVLGGALTTLDLVGERSAGDAGLAPVADACGSCTRCIDACPTGAITPYAVDARRCISYLTIERREAVEPGLAAQVGPWLYGCDVCQEVCPHNSPRAAAWVAAGPGVLNTGAAGTAAASMDAAAVLAWGEGERRGAFVSSAMKRARLDMMKRNAALVAGWWLARAGEGAGARALRAALERAMEDESAMVRDAAAWALARWGEGGRG